MLLTRVLAAIVFAPTLFALVYVGGDYLAISCLVLAGLMLWEYVRLQLATESPTFQGLTYLLGAGAAVATLGWLPTAFAGVVVPSMVLLALFVLLLQPEPLEKSITRVALVGFGAAYCGGLIPYLARLRQLEQGQGLALMALLCTWAADTGAYFVGRGIGKRKLYPRVSPGKTLEGGIGGLLCAVAVAFAVRAVFGVQIAALHTVVLGAIAGSLGVVGDLCESLLKRSVGAKDSSHLIPGHGGILDRFDAVMFVAPGFVIYLALVNLAGTASP